MSMGKFHFTKSTVEASIWCNTCRKMTPWRIIDGRRAYCIPCYDAKKSNPQEGKPVETQIDLFTGEGK